MLYAPAAQVDVAMPAAPADIAAGFALPVVIPSSGKLLVRVALYVEQTSGIYLMGYNSGTGTGDGLTRVVSGAHDGNVSTTWLWTHPAPGSPAAPGPSGSAPATATSGRSPRPPSTRRERWRTRHHRRNRTRERHGSRGVTRPTPTCGSSSMV